MKTLEPLKRLIFTGVFGILILGSQRNLVAEEENYQSTMIDSCSDVHGYNDLGGPGGNPYVCAPYTEINYTGGSVLIQEYGGALKVKVTCHGQESEYKVMNEVSTGTGSDGFKKYTSETYGKSGCASVKLTQDQYGNTAVVSENYGEIVESCDLGKFLSRCTTNPCPYDFSSLPDGPVLQIVSKGVIANLWSKDESSKR